MKKLWTVFILLAITLVFTLSPLSDDSNCQANTTIMKKEVNSYLEPIVQATSNTTIYSHTMELRFQSDFTVSAVSTIIFENIDLESQTHFHFAINKTITSPFVFDPYGSLSFTPKVFENSFEMNITLRYPLLANQMCVIHISYELVIELVHNQEPNEYYIFQFPFRHYRDLNMFNLEIYLPINNDLALDETPYAVLPTDATRVIDSGLVKITWELDSVIKNYEYIYQISFKEVDSILIPTTIVVIPSFVYTLMGLTFILGLTLASFVSLMIFKRRIQPRKSSLVSSLLSDSEQAVIQAINDEGGMAIQKRICERTAYSKSKVSQILLKLEEKDILKRERWGRTNRVTITNENFKKIELDVPEPEIEDEW